MLKCVEVCSSVLQCCCPQWLLGLQCVAVCCSVLQCVAVCCSVLHCCCSQRLLGRQQLHSTPTSPTSIHERKVLSQNWNFAPKDRIEKRKKGKKEKRKIFDPLHPQVKLGYLVSHCTHMILSRIVLQCVAVWCIVPTSCATISRRIKSAVFASRHTATQWKKLQHAAISKAFFANLFRGLSGVHRAVRMRRWLFNKV